MITHDKGDTLKQSVSEQALGLAKDVGTSKGKEAASRVAKVYFHYQSERKGKERLYKIFPVGFMQLYKIAARSCTYSRKAYEP